MSLISSFCPLFRCRWSFNDVAVALTTSADCSIDGRRRCAAPRKSIFRVNLVDERWCLGDEVVEKWPLRNYLISARYSFRFTIPFKPLSKARTPPFSGGLPTPFPLRPASSANKMQSCLSVPLSFGFNFNFPLRSNPHSSRGERSAAGPRPSQR